MPICKIDKIITNGLGLCRYKNKVNLLEYVIDSEVVEFEIIKEYKNYNKAQLKKIILHSKFRQEPECRYFYRCGGCNFQYINYNKEIDIKKDILKDNLKRLADIYKDNIEIFKNENPYFYRNRIILHRGLYGFGLFYKNTNKVVKIDKCLIQSKKINEIILKINQNFEKFKVFCCIKLVELDGKVLSVFFYEKDDFIISKRFFENLNLDIVYICKKNNFNFVFCNNPELIIGKNSFLSLKFRDFIYFVDYNSFFQVNLYQLENIFKVLDRYKDLIYNKVIVDAYSGVGTFSLYFSKLCKKVISIESNLYATKLAKYSLEKNNIDNITILSYDIDKSLTFLTKLNFDFIFLDPPRKGLSKKFIKFLLNKKIYKIFYLSCNPSTLARDLKSLKKLYKIKKIYLFDMFTRTSHFETLVVLKRKKED